MYQVIEKVPSLTILTGLKSQHFFYKIFDAMPSS